MLGKLLTLDQLAEKLQVPKSWIYERTRGSTIQRIAGHSSLVTTQKYLHPNTEEMRRSLEALETRQKIERKTLFSGDGS